MRLRSSAHFSICIRPARRKLGVIPSSTHLLLQAFKAGCAPAKHFPPSYGGLFLSTMPAAVAVVLSFILPEAYRLWNLQMLRESPRVFTR